MAEIKSMHGGEVKHSPSFTDAYIYEIVAELEEILGVEFHDEDVELEAKRSDETMLGHLTPLEKRCFVVGMLLSELVHMTIREISASAAEGYAKAMRDRSQSVLQAAQNTMGNLRPSDDQIETIQVSGIYATMLISMYEVSVRRRFNEWKRRIMVRSEYRIVAF